MYRGVVLTKDNQVCSVHCISSLLTIPDMAGVGPREILTHSQRVCRLYKKAYRTMESWAIERYHFRFNAVVLRARFDETRSIKDMRILAKMLEDGET